MKPTTESACFLAAFSRTPCTGRLVRAHLIPKRLLKQAWKDLNADHPSLRQGAAWTASELDAWMWDERSWVWACGGIMGNAGHHGELDHARTLRVPRHALPPVIEELAAEVDAKLGRETFAVFLDRNYGAPDGR